MDDNILVIGIAGGTGSGITTLMNNLISRFEGMVTVISHDNYYKRHDDMTYEERSQLNYDEPAAFDTSLMVYHLEELRRGHAIECPVYDFTIHNRSEQTIHIVPKKVIIVEGILIFENEELRNLMDIRIFVDTDADIRLCRRTLRDAATRGRSPAKTLAMWDRVMDGETRYIKGFKTTADFLLDTSFTYELGLIAKLLQKVRQQFTLEGHNAELWDETARRFEHVAPVALDLLPADSMLREFYAGEIGGKTAQ